MIAIIVVSFLVRIAQCAPPVDWIERSPSGAYQFAYATGDEGGHYRTEAASADSTVAGKFGFRDPGSGANLETTYTSGRRGFRARGPHIARRMGLSQAGGPTRPNDDGQYHPELDNIFDPAEDRGYDFQFGTRDVVKEEHADARGDVRGRYSYLDDVGARHTVEYVAGANMGFNVINPVPDTFAQAQGSPLFFQGKGLGSRVRGFSAVQKALDGSYRFSASGPDHKRTEVSDSIGNRRGSYTYLDDKGQQRTVEYIAGPNIGYQVINNRNPILFGPTGTPITPVTTLPPLPSLFPDPPTSFAFFPTSPTPTPLPTLTPPPPTPIPTLDWTITTPSPSWLGVSDPRYNNLHSIHNPYFPEEINTAESQGFKARKNETNGGSCCGRSWQSGSNRDYPSRGHVKFNLAGYGNSNFVSSSPRPVPLRAHVQNIGAVAERYMSPSEALELYSIEEAEHRNKKDTKVQSQNVEKINEESNKKSER